MASGIRLRSERLDIRPPTYEDRTRFVELFTDPEFMVFAGVCDHAQAIQRFDQMLGDCALVPFTKRPVVERATGEVLGYAGVAPFELGGELRLEFGYRLVTSARGKGYATEAGLALLQSARESWTGRLLGMIDPTNAPSINVMTKLGFEFWKQAPVHGDATNLYELEIP